jgi:hypothetical protein
MTIFERAVEILEGARRHVSRSVSTAMVHAYWLIGREIVEVEQRGRERAGYGDRLVEGLARRLSERFAAGSASRTSATCGSSTSRSQTVPRFRRR